MIPPFFYLFQTIFNGSGLRTASNKPVIGDSALLATCRLFFAHRFGRPGVAISFSPLPLPRQLFPWAWTSLNSRPPKVRQQRQGNHSCPCHRHRNITLTYQRFREIRAPSYVFKLSFPHRPLTIANFGSHVHLRDIQLGPRRRSRRLPLGRSFRQLRISWVL